jgi:hypothetical protein
VAAVKAADALIFEAIVDHADLAASLARSTAEAAFREDRHELRIQLLRLRSTVVEMLKTHNDLGGAA